MKALQREERATETARGQQNALNATRIGVMTHLFRLGIALSVLLSAQALSPITFSAQPASEVTNRIPERRAFAHHARITEDYDKFDAKTVVSFNNLTVDASHETVKKYAFIRLRAAFSYSGQHLTTVPQTVSLDLCSTPM